MTDKTISANTAKIGYWFAVTTLLSFSLLYLCCNRESTTLNSGNAQEPVRFVSWGGALQSALIEKWIKPAADSVGIKIQSDTWDGDHAALALRIKRDINDWDIVHVEQFFIDSVSAQEVLQNFEERKLITLLDVEDLKRKDAVPLMEYGYVLAFRTDKISTGVVPNWISFWDTRAIPGRRAIRDWPLGNIEIALLSLNQDPDKVLYDTSKSRAELEEVINHALNRLDELRPSIEWWTQGDQVQRYLSNGDITLAAAYSGRTMAAFRSLNPELPPNDSHSKVRVNPETVIVGTDWLIIPRGAPHAKIANQLLEAMFSKENLVGAKKFSETLGYRAPCQISFEEPVSRFFLDLGSSSTIDLSSSRKIRLNEKFWGLNYGWIDARWHEWRTSH